MNQSAPAIRGRSHNIYLRPAVFRLFAASAFALGVASATGEPSSYYRTIKPLPMQPGLEERSDSSLALPLQVREPAGVPRTQEPVRGGIPFSAGKVFDAKRFALEDAAGKPVAAQFEVLSRWWVFDEAKRKPDEAYAIKWVAVSFQTDLQPNEDRKFVLRYLKKPVTSAAMPVKESDRELVVDTGRIKAVFGKGDRSGLQQITMNGQPLLAAPVGIEAKLRFTPVEPEYRMTVLDNLNDPKRWRFQFDANADGEAQGWGRTDFRDEKWPHINPMEPWLDQGFPGKHGHGWYRVKFDAPESWKGRPVLFWFRYGRFFHPELPAPAKAVTFYLNGKKLTTVTHASESRKFVQLDSALNFGGTNVLAIDVHDAGSVGGLVCVPQIVAKFDPAKDKELDKGGTYRANAGAGGELRLVSTGPVRTVVEWSGWLEREDRARKLQYRTYYTFHRDSAAVDVSFNFVMTENPNELRIQSLLMRWPLQRQQGATLLTDGLAAGHKLSADERVFVRQYHDGDARYPGYPTLLDNPLKLRFDVQSNKGGSLATGAEHGGWFAVAGDKGGVSCAMRDFWRAYPSELSWDGKSSSIEAHMWPADGPELDLRIWPLAKDARWNEVVEKAKKPENKTEAFIVRYANYFGDVKDELALGDAEGLSWTRQMRFEFHNPAQPAPKAPSLAAAARAFEQPPHPFVSTAYNCATEAFGLPQHPYDIENFPISDLAIEANILWSEKVQQEWAKVLGMFYYGMIQYEFHTGEPNLKTDWHRRWRFQESGEAHSASVLMQYLRTGFREHLDYGSCLARHDRDVTVKSYSSAPNQVARSRKHRMLWDTTIIDHTNLEGVMLHYFLTGDELTGARLREWQEEHVKWDIHRWSPDGKRLMERLWDGAVLNVAILWFLNGDSRCREHLLRDLDYYRWVDKRGYNGVGGATYRANHFTRAWYLTRHRPFYELASVTEGPPGSTSVLRHFANGENRDLYESYLLSLSSGRQTTDNLPATREALVAKDGIEISDFRSPMTSYPGVMQAALARAGLPSAEHVHRTHPQFLVGMMYRGVNFNKAVAAEGHRFSTIPLHGHANADPYANLDARPTQPRLGIHQAHDDSMPPIPTQLAKGAIGFDFGPLSGAVSAPGWTAVSGDLRYPTFTGTEYARNFSAYPFGATTPWMGVPFELIDPFANKQKGYIRLDPGVKIAVPVKRKVSRLFFLGHVAMNGSSSQHKDVARYLINYDDGTSAAQPLTMWTHLDPMFGIMAFAPRATNVNGLRRFEFDQFLHLNVFELKTDAGKTLQSITLEGLDSASMAVLAITCETPEAAKDTVTEKVLFDAAENRNRLAAPTVHHQDELVVALENGLYDLALQVFFVKGTERLSEHNSTTMTVEAQDRVAVASAYLDFYDTFEFPVRVTDGKLRIRVHAAMLPDDFKERLIRKVAVRPRTEPAPWVEQRRDLRSLFCYGLNKGANDDTDYPGANDVQRDFLDVTGNGFRANVPNGSYALTAYVFSKLGYGKFVLAANGTKSNPADLPAQEMDYPYAACRSYEQVTANVTVNNGLLSIDFDPDKQTKPVYLRAMTLVPTTLTPNTKTPETAHVPLR